MRMSRKARLRAREAWHDAEDARSLNAHLEECAAIAVMLREKNETRRREAAHFGPWAAAAEQKEAQKRARFARLFASWGLAHLTCPAGVCLRARRCAHSGLVCLQGHTLTAAERAQANARYREFMQFMSAPENESEQGFGREG
jgi:hypothetical protein